MNARRWIGSGAAAALLAAASPLAAERAVSFAVDGCAALDRAAVERMAFLDRALQSAPASAEPVRVRIRCAGEKAEVTVELDGRRAARTVELAGFPAGSRDRVIALAVAELAAVAVSIAVGSPARRLGPARPGRALPVKAEERVELTAAPEPAATQNLEIAGRLSMLGRGNALFGVGVGYTHLLGPFALTVDAHYDHGEVPSSLGRVAMDMAGGGARVALPARLGPVRFDPAVGFRVGALRLSGIAANRTVDADELTGPAGGPLASLGAALSTGAGFVRIGGEVGYLAFKMRADIDDVTERKIKIRGAWLTAQVGAGFDW
jgi:hypothetical protein